MTSERSLPAAGITVLDLGIITAGASTSAILADLGADVVKVESASYMDPFRHWDVARNEGRWWDQSPLYRFTNRNKRGVSLDLKQEAGRALVLDLVARADVVVENFRRGVMDKLGLGIDSLRAANPRVVLASISSQGEDGPDRDAVSFGSTLDATSGLASLTGYEDGEPLVSGRDVNYPDQVSSIFAAGAILVAVAHARKTGEGGHLELAQRELATFLIGEEVMRAVSGGEDRPPMGNATEEVWWQDCLATSDGWVAVTVASEGDAARIGLGTDGFPAAMSRWAGERGTADVVATLQGHGIAAAPVRDSRALADMPFEEFGWALARDPDGAIAKGFPFQLRTAALSVERRAPNLGEHTADVLRELLDLPGEEIERLDSAGVTADRPD